MKVNFEGECTEVHHYACERRMKMLDDDCIYCQEIPTTDPNMPRRKCLYDNGLDECIGILNCAKYASKAVGITPYKPEDFRDHYDVVSKPSHYDWDLSCNLENTVRNEKGGIKTVDCIYCNDKGMSKPTCGLYGGLCPGIIEACEGYEPIPDCAYMYDVDGADSVMCSKWGGPDTCIGFVSCSEYKPVNGKKPLSSIHLPKCKHRALYRPEYCGGPLATADGHKCEGETKCLYYEEGDEKKEMSSNFDVIHKPSHYTEGRKYEPKDVIRDWDLNFNLGNTVKYVARAGRKDDILQDLKKARQYLDFEIEYLEKEREEK